MIGSDITAIRESQFIGPRYYQLLYIRLLIIVDIGFERWYL